MTTLSKAGQSILETAKSICSDGTVCQWVSEALIFAFCFSVIGLSIHQIA